MKNCIYTMFVICLLSACATQPRPKIDLINLEINKQQWLAVTDFGNSSPNDRHYVVHVDSDSSTVITFGDGVHGARPPSDTQTIRVQYRRGGGYSGVAQQQGRINEKECQ